MPRTSRPIALITGASSGIGLELARELASRGHDIILSARRADRLDASAKELRDAHASAGMTCHVIVADLSSASGPRELAREAVSVAGRVDMLVNNAGFGLSGRLDECESERLDEMVRVNVGAVTTLSRELLPPMIGRGSGWILNIASTAAFVPGPMMAVYYASKAYVESFSVALRCEMLGAGVCVSALCPGPTSTEFSNVARAGKTKLFRHAKSMDPREVARIGVDGVLANRAIVIPGFANRFAALMAKLAPRTLAAGIAGRMNAVVDK